MSSKNRNINYLSNYIVKSNILYENESNLFVRTEKIMNYDGIR